MTQEYLNQLKSIYCESVLPIIVCDELLNILWKNDACSSDDIINSGDFTDARRVFGPRPASSGFFTVEISNFLFNCNSILIAGKGFVISFCRVDFTRTCIFPEPLKGTLKNLAARMRTSVSTIAVAADEIYRILQIEKICDKYSAEQLNLIEGNLSLILREVIGAEELMNISTAAETKTDVNIADTMNFLAESVNDLYDDGGLEIKTETEPGISVEVSKSLFETVLSIIVEDLLSLPTVTQKLTISSYINQDDMAEILFTADSISNAENIIDPDYVDLTLYEKSNTVMNHLKYNFAKVYNGKIEENYESEKPYAKIILPASDSSRPIISMGTVYKPKNTRFNPFISRLSLIKKKKRYTEKGEQSK